MSLQRNIAAEYDFFNGLLGETALSKTHMERAMELLDRLPERQRLVVEAEYAFAEEDNPEKAAQRLEALIAKYPDEELAYDNLVHVYIATNELDRLLDLLERWSQAFPGPGSGHLHNHYGYALLEKGLHAEAIGEFEAYARVSPDEANPHDSMGEVYLITGRPERALESYTSALALDASFASSHAGRAIAYGILGRYQDALAELAMLDDIGERGNVPVNWNYFVTAFTHSRVGHYEEAEDYLERAIRRAERFENVQQQVETRLLSAILQLEQGDYVSALLETERASSMIPDIPREIARKERLVLAHLLSGVAEARTGRLDEAHGRLEAQGEIYDRDNPSQKWYRQALAGEIAFAEGDLVEAEKAFLAGEVEPRMWFYLADTPRSFFANSLPFRDGLAPVKKAQGDLAGAIEVYRKLNTADPSSKWVAMYEPRFVLEIARLLDQQGDEERARQEYQRFVELWSDADPGLPELEEARAYLATR